MLSIDFTKLNAVHELVTRGETDAQAFKGVFAAPPSPPPMMSDDVLAQKLKEIYNGLHGKAGLQDIEKDFFEGFAYFILKPGKLEAGDAGAKAVALRPALAASITKLLAANQLKEFIELKKYAFKTRMSANGLAEIEASLSNPQAAVQPKKAVNQSKAQQAKADLERAATIPGLNEQIAEIQHKAEAFVADHVRLESMHGLTPEVAASMKEFVAMNEFIRERNDRVQKAKSAASVYGKFSKYLTIETEKRQGRMAQLQKEIAADKQRMANLSPAYQPILGLKIAEKQAEFDVLAANQAPKEFADENYLMEKINKFWFTKITRFAANKEVSKETVKDVQNFFKTEEGAEALSPKEMLARAKAQRQEQAASSSVPVKKEEERDANGLTKAQQEWMGLLVSAYQQLTGKDLNQDEGQLLAFVENAKLLNNALKGIVENSELSSEAKNVQIKELLDEFSAILHIDMFQIVNMMSLQKYSGIGAGDVPDLKSEKYLQIKVAMLDHDQFIQSQLAKAYDIADPEQAKARFQASSSSGSALPSKEAKGPKAGIGKDGKLSIMLFPPQSEKAAKRDWSKDVKAGLLVTVGNERSIVMPKGFKNAPKEKVKVSDKEFSFVGEAVVAKSVTENPDKTSYDLYLDIMTPDQLKNLANFLGPKVALTFDPSKAADVENVTDIYKDLIRKSKLTMGDVMLVALGYIQRSPETAMQMYQLSKEGFFFDYEHLSPAEIFAEEFVLKQAEDYQGERKNPIKIENAVVAVGIKHGSAAAESIAHTYAGIDGQIANRVEPSIGKIKELLPQLLAEAEGNEDEPSFKAAVAEFEVLMGRLAKLAKPQEELHAYLSKDPKNIYSEEGKQALAECYALAIASKFELDIIEAKLAKLANKLPEDIQALIRAKEALDEKARLEAERKEAIARVREGIKVTMLGAADAPETPEQTDMLDQIAEKMYESLNPNAKAAAPQQRIQDAVVQQQAQIQVVQQRIGDLVHSSRPEDAAEILRLRQQVEELMRQLAESIRLREAMEALQEHRARQVRVSPREIYEQTHNVSEMFKHAAETHTELELSTVLTWVRQAERSNRTTQNQKVSQVMSEFNNFKQKYGW